MASADQETAPPMFMGTLISLSRQKRPCRIHLLAVSEYLALKVSSALAHCVSISEAVSLESAFSCGWTILEKTLASLLIGLSEFRKNASALVRGIRCRHKNTNKAGLPRDGLRAVASHKLGKCQQRDRSSGTLKSLMSSSI